MKTSGMQNHTIFTTNTLGGAERYWFGFNGAELENEIYGEGNAYDLGLRMYDARLARMFSIDPLASEYPWQSPYVYHRNSPIAVIDFMGGGDGPPDDEISEPEATEPETTSSSYPYSPLIPNMSTNTGSRLGDYAGAINNLAINAINIVPMMWNSAVANVEALNEGTWTETVSNDFSAKGRAVESYVTETWNYTISTPISQQFVDAGTYIISPSGVANLTGFALGFGYMKYMSGATQPMTFSSISSTTAMKGRVFWSGGDIAKTNAMSFAKINGMKTLEMTASGRIMNTVSPYLPRSISSPIWDGLSRNFARGATGNINVFHNPAGISLTSTWRRIEYPILQNNNIIFHTVK